MSAALMLSGYRKPRDALPQKSCGKSTAMRVASGTPAHVKHKVCVLKFS